MMLDGFAQWDEGRFLEVIPTLGQQGITVSREAPINYINRGLQTQYSQIYP